MGGEDMDDLKEVYRHLDQVASGIKNLQALPLWAQAAHSFLTYNPEAVQYQVLRWRQKLESETDEEGRIVAVLIAARRIYRFGAGRDVDAELWDHVSSKIDSLDHPEDLAEALLTEPIEPQYFSSAGHKRGEWPIRILPEQFYVESVD